MEQENKERIQIYEPLAEYFPEEDELEGQNLEQTAKTAYRNGVKDLHPDLGGEIERFDNFIDTWNLISDKVSGTNSYSVISYEEDFIELAAEEDRRYQSDGGEVTREEKLEEVEDDRDRMEKEICRELENLNQAMEVDYELERHTFPGDQENYSLTRITDNSSPLNFAVEANSENGTFDYKTTFFTDEIGELQTPSYEKSFEIEEIIEEDENRFQDQFFRDIAQELVENAEEFKSQIGIT